MNSRKHYILIGVLTLILLVSQFYLQYTLVINKSDSEYINQSGRQRMLSQKITKLVLLLDETDTETERKQFRNELSTAIQEITESQKNLIQYADTYDDDTIHVYFQEAAPFLKNLTQNAEQLVSGNGNYNEIKKAVLINESLLLKQMELITARFELLSTQQVTLMSTIQYVVLCLTILIILFETFWIYRPTLLSGKQQERDNDMLTKMINNLENYAVLFLDVEGNIRSWNKGARNIKGYRKDEILGKSFINFYTEEDQKNKKPQHLLELAAKNKTARDEGWRVKKDGSKFWASVTLMRVTDEKGKLVGFGKITRDLTTHKKAMQFMEIRNNELEQFTYIASHDLQEPLRTISNYIQVIEEDYEGKLDKTIFSYLTSINNASKRMTNLVRTLLDYSRVGKKAQIKIVDCNKLLGEVITDLDGLISMNNATIEVGDLPVINAYYIELRQLFQNLLNNAVKFKRDGTDPLIKISCKEKSKAWEFCVEDNGIGIGKNHFNRIFQVFQQVQGQAKYHGYGIGLANCKKIVQLHNGEIWVESELGKGSRFYFTISNHLV